MFTETTLLFFDPYNVRSSGDYLYHPHFIAYGTHELPPNFLKGTYITRMKSRTRTIEEIWRDTLAYTRSRHLVSINKSLDAIAGIYYDNCRSMWRHHN